MNYKLIIDEQELDKFINWLPDLTDDEKYYGCLFARKKYAPNSALKHDKTQLKRFVCRKQHIKENIQKLEVKKGLYQFDEVPVSEESLALYITPNPRSMHQSGLRLMKMIADDLYNEKTLRNPKALSMNAIQVTASRRLFFDVDIDLNDTTSPSRYQIFDSYWCNNFNDIPGTFVATRGGYHFLVDLQSERLPKNWYQRIQKNNDIFDVQMGKDALLPIPGCCQGGTCPRIIL